MFEPYKEYKKNESYLKAFFSKNEEQRELIEDNFHANTDISEYKVELIFEYINKKELNVAFISDFNVPKELAGKGIGTELINKFKKDSKEGFDFEILFARSENKQQEGFVLEEFYEKHGFKSVLLEFGDILMVTKGYELIFEDILHLKEERKRAFDFFNKQDKLSYDQKKTKDFMIKKEKYINEMKKTKNKKKKRQKIR